MNPLKRKRPQGDDQEAIEKKQLVTIRECSRCKADIKVTNVGRQYKTCQKCRDKKKVRDKRYYMKNKEKLNIKNKEYYEKHKDDINMERRTKRKERTEIPEMKSPTTTDNECSTCGKLKPWSEFHRKRESKNGHSNMCKKCCSSYKKNRWDDDRKTGRKFWETLIHATVTNSINKKLSQPTLTKQQCLDLFKTIGGRCQDSNVLMVEQAGKQNSVSLIRNDYMKGYSIDNIKLVMRSMVVGQLYTLNPQKNKQIFNFDEKSSEMKHYSEMDIVNDKAISKFINKKLKDCDKSANIRKTKNRNDQSHKFALTETIIVDMLCKQNFRCSITQIPLQFERHNEYSMSIDRLDNSKGYTSDNIRLIISILNTHAGFSDETVSKIRERIRVNPSFFE